jgi:hypothetical protein
VLPDVVGAVHQCELDVLELPDGFDVVREPAGINVVGVVLADVLDEL